MPSPADILRGLHTIANEAWMVAVVWHLVIAVALVAAAAGGWRPKRRLVAIGLALPLASVSVAAIAYGNPFNGAMFAVLGALVIALGLRLPDAPVRTAPPWAIGAGVLSLAYGWVYPHFLEAPAHYYLFAAPVGLVPCPTLALVIGLALLARGLDSRGIALTLGGAALGYGLFGAFHLGVRLDLGLLAASAAILACGAITRSQRSLRRSMASSR